MGDIKIQQAHAARLAARSPILKRKRGMVPGCAAEQRPCAHVTLKTLHGYGCQYKRLCSKLAVFGSDFCEEHADG